MRNANIVIVEDESIVALDIKNRLHRLGYTVLSIASTGEMAVKIVSQLQPDIVLMDIQLKGNIDGIEAATMIRAQFDIPIVYLTAYADELTLQRAKLTETYGYLLKPFEERELSATIETALYKHRMERRLKEHGQWLATTLNSIGDAVIATDTNGRITFINPVAEKLIGLSQQDVQNKHASEVIYLIDEDTGEDYSNIFDLVLAHKDGSLYGEQTCLISKQGIKTAVDASTSSIKDENGNINGVVIVFRDITHRRHTETQLRSFAEELQVQNEELDAFAHTVAHDLQNPLGNIVSMADALRIYHKDLSGDRLTTYLEHIVNNGLKMSNIIDSLLLLAGVRRKASVITTELDMEKIIIEAQKRIESMIAASQAQIILPKSWPVAKGYAPWIEEVWANYLTNGIKYGGQPPVLELGADSLSDHTIQFWIKDNGVGIDPQKQSALFTPFTKLNQVQTKGQGLGLSIVRRIVEKLDGTVGAHSNGLGHGSCFFFTLPAANLEPVGNKPSDEV